MPGPNFAALALDATAAVDGVMAEPWAFLPMAKPADKTAADVSDDSRQGGIVNATYLDRVAPRELITQGYNTPQKRPPGVETGTPRLWVSPAEVGAQEAALGVPFTVRAADQFERLSTCELDTSGQPILGTGDVWRVASVEPTAGGALRCNVNRLG